MTTRESPEYIDYCIKQEFPDATGYAHSASQNSLTLFYADGKSKTLKQVFSGTFEQLLAKHENAFKWKKIREFRQKLLKRTDFTELNDYNRNKNEWKQYRQSLRDITINFGDPDAVVWPMAPEPVNMGGGNLWQ